MTDVFYLRPLDVPATPEAVLDSIHYVGGCFDMHRVEWTHSFLAADGARLLCWYLAPDAESARIALRELGSDMSAVWPGRVIGGVEARQPIVSEVSVLAEIPLGTTAGRDDAELLANLRSSARDHGEIAFGFLSSRRDRVVCLLRDGDPQRLRAALGRGGFAGATAWHCRVVTPPRR